MLADSHRGWSTSLRSAAHPTADAGDVGSRRAATTTDQAAAPTRDYRRDPLRPPPRTGFSVERLTSVSD